MLYRSNWRLIHLIFIYLLLIINHYNYYSQEKNSLNKIFFNFKLKKFNDSKRILETSNLPLDIKKIIQWQIDYKCNGNNISRFPHKNFKNTYQNDTYKIIKLLALADFYKEQNKDSLMFLKLVKAKKIAISNSDSLFVCETMRKIFPIFFSNSKLLIMNKNYLETYHNFAYDNYEKYWFRYYNLRYKTLTEFKDYSSDFYNLQNEIDSLKYPFTKAKYLQYLGVLSKHFKKDYKLSNHYYERAYYLYSNNTIYTDSLSASGVLVNIGDNDIRLGKNNSGLNKLNTSLKKIKKNEYKSKLYLKLSNIYSARGNYKLSHFYLKEKIALDSIDYLDKLSNLEVKFRTAEKDKIIIETESKRKLNRNYFIVSTVALIFGTIIYILSFKNSKRKRKLAEQEKEIQTQKNLTLLKEQELTTINAMVEGQEKERKRVAEDLHDNLGSILATLKLHFENLKINQETKKINQEKLFNKTETLIDEAYLKVRSIAHAKNAGVIANQGLLIAIQMMAEKISSADKIQIEVIDYGLDKRLENTLEITVFRIIQELITNIIKHANASEATINISVYDSSLNIIIEDNGKGFDVKTLNLKDGMGISSIKTRVEHLEGTFKIDSTIGKGSSILIDIPVS